MRVGKLRIVAQTTGGESLIIVTGSSDDPFAPGPAGCRGGVGRQFADALPNELSSRDRDRNPAVDRDRENGHSRVAGRPSKLLHPIHSSEHASKDPLEVRGSFLIRLVIRFLVGFIVSIRVEYLLLIGSNGGPDSAGTE